jgi:regulatory protein
MDAALLLLKFRGRSEKEMGERLRKKGFEAETAASTVARLKELKLVDDAALARQWTEGARRAGRGEGRIRQDLWKRGIPRDIIALALAGASEGAGPAEIDRARDALSRRLKRMKTDGLDRGALYRRLAGFLARQGFSPDVARDALNEALKGLKSSDDFEE